MVPEQDDLNSAWETEKPADGPSIAPPGTYQARILEIEEAYSQNDNLQAVWKFELLSGPANGVGKTVKKFQTVTINTIPYVKADVIKVGIRPETIKDLETDLIPGLQSAVGRYVEVQLSKKRDSSFPEVNIRKLVDEPLVSKAPDGEGSDIPF